MSRTSGKLPCPVCDGPTTVYDSQIHNGYVRRRRQCQNGHRFNTQEEPIDSVWNRNGDVVPIAKDAYDDELRDELMKEGAVDEM